MHTCTIEEYHFKCWIIRVKPVFLDFKGTPTGLYFWTIEFRRTSATSPRNQEIRSMSHFNVVEHAFENAKKTILSYTEDIT